MVALLAYGYALDSLHTQPDSFQSRAKCVSLLRQDSPPFVG